MELEEKLAELRKFLVQKGLTQEAIANRFGVSKQAVNQLLTGRKPFGKQNAQRWADEFGLSVAWLLTGEGNMIASSEPIVVGQMVDNNNAIWLPVINLDTRGGLLPNSEADTIQYKTTLMPFSRNIARDGDFVMPVVGDSMTPKYPNGTFVLVRPLPTWREYIELGATYVLELLDGRRLIKDVRAGDDREHFRLYSVNPTFDPTEVAKNFIAHIFAVIVAVRRDLNW